MSDTLKKIKALVQSKDVRISEHGYDELSNDSLTVKSVVEGIVDATLVEDYPGYPKGVCVLVLQQDRQGNPVHVVWGIPKNHSRPAVLITAYRPDSDLWDKEYMRRKK